MIEVRKVETKRQMQDFVRVTRGIYKGCPQYVPDMEGDIRDFFNPRRNCGLEFSDVQPFVAYRVGDSQTPPMPVGRIAGIINHKANRRWNTRTVRFSMIEFPDDSMVSAALLDAVSSWGSERGMDTLLGPMGITDFDKEGMLVEGFDRTGSAITYYNPSYYPRHIEAWGLKKEVDWLQLRVNIPHEVPARYARVAQYAREHLHLRVIKLTNRDIIQGGYGQRIFQLLNTCYHDIFGFSELSSKQADEFIKKYLLLVDKELVPVVVNDRQEVIGVAITMGSLTRALQRSQGRLLPWGWWHLLWSLKVRREDHVDMLLVAVRPDCQGLGVNALFFDDLIPIYNKKGFRWAETGPQLEQNQPALTQWKMLKPEVVKRRRCYTAEIKVKRQK